MTEPLKIFRCPVCSQQLGKEDACCCVEGVFNFGEEVEVIPLDSPNVLSVDEAKLLVQVWDDDARYILNWTDLDTGGKLINLLSGWASENPESTEEGTSNG